MMFKKLNEDGGTALYAIEIKNTGCIVKVDDVSGTNVFFIPGVRIQNVEGTKIPRRELVSTSADIMEELSTTMEEMSVKFPDMFKGA